MDLFEVLLLLFFVVIPLLQHFMGRRGGEGEAADESGPLDTASRPPRPQPSSAPEPEWSAGWGEWPGEGAEDDVELRDTPEAEDVQAPVVSLEEISANRAAERALGRATERAAERAADGSRLQRIYAQRESRKHAPAERLASLLRNKSDIRRGIVLAEVLGPPVAFRDLPRH